MKESAPHRLETLLEVQRANEVMAAILADVMIAATWAAPTATLLESIRRRASGYLALSSRRPLECQRTLIPTILDTCSYLIRMRGDGRRLSVSATGETDGLPAQVTAAMVKSFRRVLEVGVAGSAGDPAAVVSIRFGPSEVQVVVAQDGLGERRGLRHRLGLRIAQGHLASVGGRLAVRRDASGFRYELTAPL